MSGVDPGQTEQQVLSLLPPPQHVAIIMDGNGRWAKDRGLPREAGHREGVEALRRVVDACPDLGVKHLTVYSFSTENWNRPKPEIDALLDLLRQFVQSDLPKLHEAGVRIQILGSRQGLAPDILELINHSMRLTRDNTRFNLNIAFNYGGRDEIVQAVKELATQVAKGDLNVHDIDEARVANTIWSATSPDPDLIIRTSGEIRLSNFLLWSSAYSEMVFPDTRWPDFDKSALEAVIREYQTRNRRFGALDA